MKRIKLVLGLLLLFILNHPALIAHPANSEAAMLDVDSMNALPPQVAANYLNEVLKSTSKQQQDSLICVAHYWLGAKYQKLGKIDSSLAQLDDFFTHCGIQYPKLYFKAKLAMVKEYGRTANLDKAEAILIELDSLEKQLENNTISYRYWQAYSSFYHLSGRFKEMKTSAGKALKYALRTKNDIDISTAYTTLGVCYVENNQYDSALYSNKKAFQISVAMNDSTQIMYSAMNLGAMYGNDENANWDLDSAITYLKLAENISNRIRNLDIQLASNHYLSIAYANNEEFQLAFEKALEFRELQEQSLTELHISALNELDVKYETAAKENEILQLQVKANQQANQRNILIALVLILAIAVGGGFYVARLRGKTAKQLKKINSTKTNFYSSVSHELKTPLTLIKGPLSAIIENNRKSLDPDLLNDLELMNRNTDQLSELIVQLMDIARSDDQDVELNKTTVEIGLLTHKVIQNHQLGVRQKEIELTWQKGEDYYGITDKSLLEKVISNLVSNAIKFTPQGGRISIETTTENDQFEFRISDSGSGINENDLPYIFDRFYKSQNSSSANKVGSGIGLAVVKEFVELLGGEVGSTNNENSGASFYFSIPFPQGRAVKQDPVSNKSDYTLLSPLHTRKNEEEWPLILLVDDNKNIRKFIRKNLDGFYRFIEAENGAEGYEEAKNQLPDLIISDIMMPKVDGIAFLQKLKSNEATNYIPSILLTAKGSLETRIEGWNEGADAYLSKPFEVIELQSRIQNILENRKRLKSHILAKFSQEEAEPITNKFVSQIQELVSKNIANPEFSFSDYLSEFAMSRSTFQRAVKENFNCTPQGYLKKQRLKIAFNLLQSNQGSISEIAYSVGFNSVSYFNRSFKEEFNQTPSSV